MNTRAIIMFLDDGVQIVDEYQYSRVGLIQAKPRYYYYKNMSTASYLRLSNLDCKPEATIHLVPISSTKRFTILIYWKRNNGRIYERHNRQPT